MLFALFQPAQNSIVTDTWMANSRVRWYPALMLVWSIFIGFGIWGDVPTVSLLIGSAVVVGSGLFLLWRESRKMQPKTQPLADIE